MTAAGLLDAALGYAKRGWPVLPVEPRGKVPLGRLVGHGALDATTDVERISAWWRACPAANIGVATGAPGPDVIDIDCKGVAQGATLFERAKAAGLLRGAHRLVRTPSGGLHLYYIGTERGGGAIGARRDLELKSKGGYVLAPPSAVGDRPYLLLDERDEAEGLPLDWDALVRLLAPPAPLRGNVRVVLGDARHLVDYVARQPAGNRNAALFWASCRAVEGGHAAALDDLVSAAVGAGLPEREARRAASSASRRSR